MSWDDVVAANAWIGFCAAFAEWHGELEEVCAEFAVAHFAEALTHATDSDAFRRHLADGAEMVAVGKLHDECRKVYEGAREEGPP